MSPKDAVEIANSEDLDQTASSRNSLISVCTVCPELSVPKLRIITVLKWAASWENQQSAYAKKERRRSASR